MSGAQGGGGYDHYQQNQFQPDQQDQFQPDQRDQFQPDQHNQFQPVQQNHFQPDQHNQFQANTQQNHFQPFQQDQFYPQSYYQQQQHHQGKHHSLNTINYYLQQQPQTDQFNHARFFNSDAGGHGIGMSVSPTTFPSSLFPDAATTEIADFSYFYNNSNANNIATTDHPQQSQHDQKKHGEEYDAAPVPSTVVRKARKKQMKRPPALTSASAVLGVTTPYVSQSRDTSTSEQRHLKTDNSTTNTILPPCQQQQGADDLMSSHSVQAAKTPEDKNFVGKKKGRKRDEGFLVIPDEKRSPMKHKKANLHNAAPSQRKRYEDTYDESHDAMIGGSCFVSDSAGFAPIPNNGTATPVVCTITGPSFTSVPNKGCELYDAMKRSNPSIAASSAPSKDSTPFLNHEASGDKADNAVLSNLLSASSVDADYVAKQPFCGRGEGTFKKTAQFASAMSSLSSIADAAESPTGESEATPATMGQTNTAGNFPETVSSHKVCGGLSFDYLSLEKGSDTKDTNPACDGSMSYVVPTDKSSFHGTLLSGSKPSAVLSLPSSSENRIPSAPVAESKKTTAIKTPYAVEVNVTKPAKPFAAKKSRCQSSGPKKIQQLDSVIRQQYARAQTLPTVSTLEGPQHLVASVLPSSFPALLSFQALGAYSLIRTLSIPLRLSPFTPNAFLRALALPVQNKLLGTIHAAILRLLFAQHNLGIYLARGDGLSKSKTRSKDGVVQDYLARSSSLHKRARENLSYLDAHTWPLFYDDYANIMLSSFLEADNDAEMVVDGRSATMKLIFADQEDYLSNNNEEMEKFFKSQPSELVEDEEEESEDCSLQDNHSSNREMTQNTRQQFLYHQYYQQQNNQPNHNVYGTAALRQQNRQQMTETEAATTSHFAPNNYYHCQFFPQQAGIPPQGLIQPQQQYLHFQQYHQEKHSVYSGPPSPNKQILHRVLPDVEADYLRQKEMNYSWPGGMTTRPCLQKEDPLTIHGKKRKFDHTVETTKLSKAETFPTTVTPFPPKRRSIESSSRRKNSSVTCREKRLSTQHSRLEMRDNPSKSASFLTKGDNSRKISGKERPERGLDQSDESMEDTDSDSDFDHSNSDTEIEDDDNGEDTDFVIGNRTQQKKLKAVGSGRGRGVLDGRDASLLPGLAGTTIEALVGNVMAAVSLPVKSSPLQNAGLALVTSADTALKAAALEGVYPEDAKSTTSSKYEQVLSFEGNREVSHMCAADIHSEQKSKILGNDFSSIAKSMSALTRCDLEKVSSVELSKNILSPRVDKSDISSNKKGNSFDEKKDAALQPLSNSAVASGSDPSWTTPNSSEKKSQMHLPSTGIPKKELCAPVAPVGKRSKYTLPLSKKKTSSMSSNGTVQFTEVRNSSGSRVSDIVVAQPLSQRSTLLLSFEGEGPSSAMSTPTQKELKKIEFPENNKTQKSLTTDLPLSCADSKTPTSVFSSGPLGVPVSSVQRKKKRGRPAKDRGPPPLPGGTIKSSRRTFCSTREQALHMPLQYLNCYPQHHYSHRFPMHNEQQPSMSQSVYSDVRYGKPPQPSYATRYWPQHNLPLNTGHATNPSHVQRKTVTKLSTKNGVRARLVTPDVHDAIEKFILLGKPQPYEPLSITPTEDAGSKYENNEIEFQRSTYPSVLAFLQCKQPSWSPELKGKVKAQIWDHVSGPMKGKGLHIDAKATNVVEFGSKNDMKHLDRTKAKERNRDGILPHLQPLNCMRKGLAYHLLPITHKLVMLEYLLDELLSLDIVSSELTSRRLVTDGYNALYGSLPGPPELENLINMDECAVCGLEGDLLCCDGCTSSVHRACINVSAEEKLPEGRWLCVECSVVDPAKMGPLHGGKKSSLDWFGLNDLTSSLSSKQEIGTNAVLLPSEVNNLKKRVTVEPELRAPMRDHASPNPPESVYRDVEVDADSSLFTVDAPGDSTVSSVKNDERIEVTPLSSLSLKSDPLKLLARAEFLVVHGFVFARYAQTKEPFDPLKVIESLSLATVIGQDILLGGDLSRTKMPVPLTQVQLYALLTTLGPDLCAKWPICQIPFHPQKLWSGINAESTSPSTSAFAAAVTPAIEMQSTDSILLPECEPVQRDENKLDEHSSAAKLMTAPLLDRQRILTLLKDVQEAYSKYFSTRDSYNPMTYVNKYCRAPVHLSVQAQLGAHLFCLDQTLFDNETNPLRFSLSRDMSWDNDIVSELRSVKFIYDPLQPLKDYILKLEKMLVRSSLIHELWGLTSKNLEQNPWARNVVECRSVRKLAVLIVKLVDASHPRAFFEEWIKIPGHGPSVGSSGHSENRLFSELSPPFNIATEIRRRKWERSNEWDILRLLASESGGIRALFDKGTSERFTAGSSKRKKRMNAESTTNFLPSFIKANEKQAKLEYEPLKSQTTDRRFSEDSHTGASLVPCLGSSREKTTRSVPVIKRNATAYTLFLKEKHQEAKSASGMGNKIDEIAKNVAKLWKSLSANERAPYTNAAKLDKARYLVEKEELRLKNIERDSLDVDDMEIDDDNLRGRRRPDRYQPKSTPHNALDTIATGTEFAADIKLGHDESQAGIFDDVCKEKGTKTNAAILESEKQIKILRLEKVINGGYSKEIHWPMAGRKLFVPEGSLPHQAAKWLGRNAGMKVIPSVTYASKFEVGLAAVCYIWRRATLACASIEALVLQMRFLDSFVNKPTINSCETLTRRFALSKSAVQKVITGSLIDPASGSNECFVSFRSKHRGCWLPEDSVDQSTLILERANRIDKQQRKFAKRVEEKRQMEVDRLRHERELEAERLKKEKSDRLRKEKEAEVERLRYARTVEAEKARRKKAEQIEMRKQKKSMAERSLMEKQQRRRIEAMRKQSDKAEKTKGTGNKTRIVMPVISIMKETSEASEVKRLQTTMQGILTRFENETKVLLKENASRGLASGNTNFMTPIKLIAMRDLQATNNALRHLRTTFFSDSDLADMLQHAELKSMHSNHQEVKSIGGHLSKDRCVQPPSTPKRGNGRGRGNRKKNASQTESITNNKIEATAIELNTNLKVNKKASSSSLKGTLNNVSASELSAQHQQHQLKEDSQSHHLASQEMGGPFRFNLSEPFHRQDFKTLSLYQQQASQGFFGQDTLPNNLSLSISSAGGDVDALAGSYVTRSNRPVPGSESLNCCSQGGETGCDQYTATSDQHQQLSCTQNGAFTDRSDGYAQTNVQIQSQGLHPSHSYFRSDFSEDALQNNGVCSSSDLRRLFEATNNLQDFGQSRFGVSGNSRDVVTDHHHTHLNSLQSAAESLLSESSYDTQHQTGYGGSTYQLSDCYFDAGVTNSSSNFGCDVSGLYSDISRLSELLEPSPIQDLDSATTGNNVFNGDGGASFRARILSSQLSQQHHQQHRENSHSSCSNQYQQF